MKYQIKVRTINQLRAAVSYFYSLGYRLGNGREISLEKTLINFGEAHKYFFVDTENNLINGSSIMFHDSQLVDWDKLFNLEVESPESVIKEAIKDMDYILSLKIDLAEHIYKYLQNKGYQIIKKQA